MSRIRSTQNSTKQMYVKNSQKNKLKKKKKVKQPTNDFKFTIETNIA